MTASPDLVFIGSPTHDLVVRGVSARRSVGGAAYISALAARWSGASAGIVARVPSAFPADAAAPFGPAGLHRGGLHPMDGTLPGFRITYDDGDQAHYTGWNMGLEEGLCAADIPEKWLDAWIHIAGIGASAKQQLSVLRRLPVDRIRGLSVGTCRAMIEAGPTETLELLAASDVFFLNEEEWSLLCPDGLPDDHKGSVVITRGPDGVTVLGGPHAGSHPALPTEVIDPTGAGDAFCGGYLGALVQGLDTPVARGLKASQIVLGGAGADTLSCWVSAQVTSRADHDAARIAELSPAIASHGRAAAFNFTADPHLPEGDPNALAMLWVSTLHQYGFWRATASAGWQEPMIAPIDGVKRKGSDFIWAAFARAAREDPSVFSPERMASEPRLFETICTDDMGQCPVPQLDTHSALHVSHGHAMMRQWPDGYTAILDRVNRTRAPISALLSLLRTQPGYMADPLAKKANLLAIILSARPEGWLSSSDPENIQPIVDYHMMRLCLRTGLVRVDDPDLARRLTERTWVDPQEELAIRQATGRAILGLVEQTQRTVGAIDGLFFKLGRTVCLETEAPRCDECPLSTGCAQRTDLFQPVFRTTAY